MRWQHLKNSQLSQFYIPEKKEYIIQCYNCLHLQHTYFIFRAYSDLGSCQSQENAETKTDQDCPEHLGNSPEESVSVCASACIITQCCAQSPELDCHWSGHDNAAM